MSTYKTVHVYMFLRESFCGRPHVYKIIDLSKTPNFSLYVVAIPLREKARPKHRTLP